ncbi:hypothetical protein QTO34_001236 [Cnephaeus nilssonii]|uniref:Uncharacterized protein n=1 Tax=Cnephaeus nilssonii TaxID=3371016 RepID=A0AA40HVB6_CNENI|nr:hypothetical protein QTO34_001236 [Eptesicus nilssonii]
MNFVHQTSNLWKHQVMKENFSVIRPQIVEKFMQRLMENYQEGGLEITFRKDHLEACLLSLGCDVMARERSNFESYSMCYEHVLEHTRLKLCQKEQVAELSHDMIMEITALRARLTDLEEENLHLEKQIRKEVQEEYEDLVKTLFTVEGRKGEPSSPMSIKCEHPNSRGQCPGPGQDPRVGSSRHLQKAHWADSESGSSFEIFPALKMPTSLSLPPVSQEGGEAFVVWPAARLPAVAPSWALPFCLPLQGSGSKEKLHENQLNLIQKVCELISEVRTEWMDHMKDLKKKWGSARPDEGKKESAAKEQLRDLEQENCSLAALVCKARRLGRWRLAVQQARFRGQLSRAQKEAAQSKKECVSTKLMAEREVVLFRQQLLALRQALARAQARNVRMCEQQESQARLLKELEHKMTRESLHRQQLDLLKTSSMERLLEDVEQKEQHLQLLAEEAERAARRGQLQRKKTERELRQMRRQLAQERSVKLGAFQRVEELQSQLNDAVRSSVPMSSPEALYPVLRTSSVLLPHHPDTLSKTF